MEDDFFSLLWDSEENYEEICRLGRFGEQYDFGQIFLHPCGRVSTVLRRKKDHGAVI